MEEQVYKEDATLAILELQLLLDDIHPLDFRKKSERKFYQSLIDFFNHVLESDEQHGLKDIAELGLKVAIMPPPKHVYDIVMKVMHQVLKKIPGGEFSVEFDL
jgi:hypothetical protein